MDAQTQTPSDDWFVTFYPQTGSLRLYQSLSLAKMHVASSDILLYGYRSAVDLQKRNDHPTLEGLWRRLFEGSTLGWPRLAAGPLPDESERVPPDCSTEALATRLWGLFHRVGDRVSRASGSKVAQKDHYNLNLEKMAAVLDSGAKGYPRQCRAIIQAMYELQEVYVLEEQLKTMMLEIVGKLNTKQDHWLIFQFYRKRLMDDGLFSRGRDEEGESEETN